MQICFTFLSSKSGKSLILQINDKKYVFNIFEGFQRYCIEKKQSLAGIDCVFMTNILNIPPFIGMYLTLGELYRTNLAIVSTFDADFAKISNFKAQPNFKISYLKEYQDCFLKTTAFNTDEITNYILDICRVDGKLYPNLIPSCVPKTAYKNLIKNNSIEIDGITYFLKDYSDSPIKINRIALIYGKKEFERVKTWCSGIKMFICFNKEAYEYIKTQFYNLNKNIANCEGIFYVSGNTSIEYLDFYNSQLNLNKKNPNFLLPVSGLAHNASKKLDELEAFFCMDSLVFKRDEGLVYHPAIPIEFKTANYISVRPCLEFLGTGCAIPSKLRNVSSILYSTSISSILLDAGEDTLTQILRLHGNLEILKQLKIIYISHSHADHMLGIASILRHVTSSVVIIGPLFAKNYIKFFNIEVEDFQNISDFKDNKIYFISTCAAKTLETEFKKANTEEKLDILKYSQNLNLFEFKIKVCGCDHSNDSTSISILDTKENRSFSYSGDSMPSALFAHLSNEVDVFIHEATFSDDLIEHSKKTHHSTTSEANRIFKISKAKKLYLTHFSNRSMDIDDSSCVGDFYRHIFTKES